MQIVTCAIIIYQNRILIVQRNASSEHALKWEFPGGKVKPEETIEECIVREIKEELKIIVKIREKLTHINYDYGFRQIQLIPFVCSIKSGKIKLTEHKNLRWIDLKNMDKIDFLQADKKLLEHKKNINVLEKYLRENMNDSG